MYQVFITQALDKRKSVTMRCPGCGHYGTFKTLLNHDLRIVQSTIIGLRFCPNERCQTIVYFVLDEKTNLLLQTFPPLRIDFDKTNLPDEILKCLEEAITCHANQCYTASAIMIRKTLDLLCVDKGANGANLKDKIAKLRAKIIVPDELLEGMDALRLLGNDAAHIEAKAYNDVGKDEVEIGLEFTKEILKAVYQYSALVDKLNSLKKKEA
ncbi:MAG: DUF4145 domain-containing protein [Bacteroidetes bacterium]|nr:MAG: DUF4145 domain-containing protein [Bacteroidota bacterium]